MMKLRKFLTLALACVLILSLTACSGKVEEAKPTESTAPSATAGTEGSGEKIVVNYWTTNRHDQAYMTPLIEEFNKTNDKNIEINYQVYADNFSQMVDLAFSTGDAPDVYQITDSVLVNVEKGMCRDLAPFMDDAYKARFGEGAFVEGINKVGDAIYSVPYTGSASRLFYNQDIFDRVGITKPPETLDELVEYSKLITEKLGGEGIYGFSGNFKSPMSSIMRSVDMINMRSGGTNAGFDFRTGTYDFSSYKPVLEAYREIFTSGAGFPGSESLDIDPLRTQFAAGNLAMYISVSHAEPGVYASQFPTEVNWNCAPIPTVTGKVEGKQNLWFGGSSIGISSSTKVPDAAWEVFKFLHSDEVMGGYYSANLGIVQIPSAIEGVALPETLAKMPNLQFDENDMRWPPLPVNVVIEGKDYANVFLEAIFGVIEIDDAIADLNVRYNAGYDNKLKEGGERLIYPNFTPLTLDTSK